MRIKQLFRKLMKEIDIMKFNKTNNISLEDFLNKDLGLDEFQESYAEEASYRALNNPKGFDTLDGKGNLEVNYVKGVYKCWACSETHETHGSINKLFWKWGTKKKRQTSGIQTKTSTDR